jgi:hypothetical protein
VIIEFMDNDQGYVAWLADHPDGFVLNCERPPRPSYLTLHRATCWTISRASGTNLDYSRDSGERLPVSA